VTAVLLALASAALFGATTIAIRTGLRGGDAAVGALATIVIATAVALVAAAPRHDLHGTWPFLIAGLFAPGSSQLLFVLAIREAGAARTSVVVGTAPLVSVAVALVFLHEPLRLPLLLGAIAIVAGGVALASERDRPGHVRLVGLAFAAAAMVLFAVRDNVVRAMHTHASPEAALVATLLGGVLVAAIAARRAPTASELRALAPAGVLFGASYLCLFEAYFRGRVTVVSPLVATESLWGVGLSMLLLRRSEGVGSRLVLGALLVVAGGALIGATSG
jgi:drug/metabolite transporter (DMT)-like permease